MNLAETFQNLIAQVPELVQPLIVALAAAVPFVEGEGAVTLGIVGGIHPLVAAVAAIAGNFVCVATLVLLGSGARQAIVSNRARKRELALAGEVGHVTETETMDAAPAESARKAARREKFQRAFVRYGVPGVSLLGPLLLPTHFTATMLAAIGIGKARILFWQAVAITGWTSVIAVIITGIYTAIH